MTEFAAFAAFIVADHSFGQAPDNRDKRAPKQHFIFCQYTATILLIFTSYTVVTAFPFTVFTTQLDFLKLL